MGILFIRTLVVWALAFSPRGPIRPIQITNDQNSQEGIGGDCRKLARQAFDLTNEYRSRQGLPPVLWDINLEHVVNEHAKMMVEDPSLYSPDHPGFFDRVAKIQKVGSWSGGAWENIAYSTDHENPARTAFEGWIESPTHEKTLRSHAKYMAVGCAHSPFDNSYFFSQMFTNPEREMPVVVANSTQPRGDLACQVFDAANYARFKRRLKQFNWAQQDLYPAIANFTMDAAESDTFGEAVDASVVGKNAGHGVTWFGKIGLVSQELQGFKYGQNKDVGDEMIEKLTERAPQYLFGNYTDLAVGCAQTPEGTFYFGLLFAEPEKEKPSLVGEPEIKNQGQAPQLPNGRGQARPAQLNGRQAQEGLQPPTSLRQRQEPSVELEQPPIETAIAQQRNDYHLQLHQKEEEEMQQKIQMLRMEKRHGPYPNQDPRAQPAYNAPRGGYQQPRQQGGQMQLYQQSHQHRRPGWKAPVNKYQPPPPPQNNPYQQPTYQPQRTPNMRYQQPYYQTPSVPYLPQPDPYDPDRQQALRDRYIQDNMRGPEKPPKAAWPPPQRQRTLHAEQPGIHGLYNQDSRQQWSSQRQSGQNQRQSAPNMPPQQPPRNQYFQNRPGRPAQPSRGIDYQNQQMYQPLKQQLARDRYKENQQQQATPRYQGQGQQSQFLPQRQVQPPPPRQQPNYQQPSMQRRPPNGPPPPQQQYQRQTHQESHWKTPVNKYDVKSNGDPYWLPQPPPYMRGPPNDPQSAMQPKPPPYSYPVRDQMGPLTDRRLAMQPYQGQPQPQNTQPGRPAQPEYANRAHPKGPIGYQKQQPSYMEQQQQLREQKRSQQYAQQNPYGQQPPAQRYMNQNVPPPDQRYSNQNAPPPPGKRYANQNVPPPVQQYDDRNAPPPGKRYANAPTPGQRYANQNAPPPAQRYANQNASPPGPRYGNQNAPPPPGQRYGNQNAPPPPGRRYANQYSQQQPPSQQVQRQQNWNGRQDQYPPQQQNQYAPQNYQNNGRQPPPGNEQWDQSYWHNPPPPPKSNANQSHRPVNPRSAY